MADPTPADAAYATARMYAEMGELHYAHWKATGKWPDTTPSTDDLVAFLERVVGSRIATTAEETAIIAAWDAKYPDQAGRLPPELRRGDVMFRDPGELKISIDDAFPASATTVGELAGDTSDWDLEAWAVSLGIGGALVTIGRLAIVTKLTPQGAAVSLVAGILLLGLTSAFGLSAKTEAGKNVVRATVDELAGAAQTVGRAGSWLLTGLVVATTLAVGVGLTVYLVRASEGKKPKQLPQRSRRWADETEEAASAAEGAA